MHEYAGDSTTGFSSPAADAVEGPIDLTEVLDLRWPSRYPVRVRGATFSARGILDNDVLVVDTSATPKSGELVIACVSGTVILAELKADTGHWWLISGNNTFSSI